MNNCFEYYTLKLKTLSPVFVGSGRSFGKKEAYYSSKEDIIRLIDMNKFMQYMLEADERDGKNRLDKFEEFMINDTEKTLKTFMSDIAFPKSELENVTIYSVENKGCFQEEHTLSEISGFMRNNDNRAYIPGSSVKGMLRTVILQYLIRHNKFSSDDKPNRAAQNAENQLINTLPLKKKNGKPNVSDALNSIMKGLIVSDSEFIDDSNFIVCRKFDFHCNGDEPKGMNVVRECLNRGVEVSFKIKIDKRYFKPKNIRLSFEQLLKEATAEYDREYKRFYLSKFNIPEGNKNDFGNSFVILGGGSGFFGKNVTYTIKGFESGHEDIASLMSKNRIKGKLVNQYDMELGISPHMLKDTKIGETLYHMGMCSLECVVLRV